MTGRRPMTWLSRALIGPGLWAMGFAAAYGLHGLGCALGWTTQDLGVATLHWWAMMAVWGMTLAACVWVLLVLPRGPDLAQRLPRIGAWIGLGATAVTLGPLLVATSC